MTTGESTDPYRLPLGELLRLSQTDVTPNADLGYEYAKIALERAQKLPPHETTENPAAEGIAARQAGFRGAQAGEKPDIVWEFFSDSLTALHGKKIPEGYARECIGTYLLAGRAAMLLNLKEPKSGNPKRWFRTADRHLSKQHTKGSRWDPFGTMNDKFWATHEAMNGKALTGAGLAIRGIYRARRAERKDTPMQEHKAFIKKQTRLNVAAGLLAVSRVVSFGPIQKLREKIAEKIIKGQARHHKKH